MGKGIGLGALIVGGIILFLILRNRGAPLGGFTGTIPILGKTKQVLPTGPILARIPFLPGLINTATSTRG